MNEKKNLIFKSNKDAFEYALKNPYTINLMFNTALIAKKLGSGKYEIIVNIDGEKHTEVADDDGKDISYEVDDFICVSKGFTGKVKNYFILGKLKPELDIEKNLWLSQN